MENLINPVNSTQSKKISLVVSNKRFQGIPRHHSAIIILKESNVIPSFPL
jgi:hypothetical protein